MNLQEQMDADWKRDMEQSNKFRAVRSVINELLESGGRMQPRTRAALIEATAQLWNEMLSTEARWD